ncbi:MAG: sulfite exporter TauE/SafE family protein [Verrucomicrobia bacterium]|nr:MAG: sulfite exporter TauE/SafE family protein [Verrucomicrobiota bacterium]
MLANFGIQQLILVWLVVVFAAVLRAFTGFGFALAAVPAFSLLMSPIQSVVLSIMLTLAVSLFTLKTFWGQFSIKSLLPMISFSLLGTTIGAYFLAMLSVSSFQLWVGVSVLGACVALTFYRPGRIKPSTALARLAGLVSGLMNGFFAIPGPPVVVYAVATQPSPEKTRALLMTFFLFSASFGLVSYSAAGYVNLGSMWLFVLTFPAMYLGDKLGYRLFKRFGTRLYRRVAQVGLFGVGIAIMGRALLVATA